MFTVTTRVPSGLIARLSGEISAVAVETTRCWARADGIPDSAKRITDTVPGISGKRCSKVLTRLPKRTILNWNQNDFLAGSLR